MLTTCGEYLVEEGDRAQAVRTGHPVETDVVTGADLPVAREAARGGEQLGFQMARSAERLVASMAR
jgi:hypothetical protein